MFKDTRLKKLYLVSLLFCSLNLYGAEPLSFTGKKLFLSAMQKNLATVKSLRATLIQTRVLKVFNDKLISEGTLLFSIPDKIRWEIEKPYRSLIIFNAQTAGKFDFKDGHWNKLEFIGSDILAQVMGNVIKWTRGEFDEDGSEYHLEFYSGYRVIMIPKSEKLKKNLGAIELEIDPQKYEVRRVFIRESQGDYTEILFTKFIENPPLSEQIFDINKPSTL